MTASTATPAKTANSTKAKSEPGMDERIPTTLANESILANFCVRYLDVVDEISAYNKEVLAEKSSEWTAAKVLEKGRELAHPTDANVKSDDAVKAAMDAFSEAATALNLARRNALDITAKSLGITLSVTAERNTETEAPLKEKRKLAGEIGKQLMMIAEMTTDKTAATAVQKFFSEVPLPAIGRDQVHNFTSDEKSTPKYRTTVTVFRNGDKVLEENGFTGAALALTKLYERGKAPKSDVLRTAWENAGNSAEKPYAVSPVEFDDGDLHFVITKKG